MNLFRRNDLIRKLCKGTGRWIVIGQEGDVYDLRSNDASRVRHACVRWRADVQFIMFQAYLPLRFPLDRTPSGLFARMLLRNMDVSFAHWHMDLRGSAEAVAYLAGQWPLAGMTPKFFDAVCREMTDEVHAFHQELREKFRGTTPWTTVAGFQGYAAEAHVNEPVPESISGQIRSRMLGGHQRYSLE